MAKFKTIVDSQPGSKHILQGNEAFALGVVHAGYHAVDGYPGTPSTEVIDKSLQHMQDRMIVGWSVNEAVAVGVGIGHSVAGFDTVVTMKTPGAFQAGDPITTSAFYTADAGALVLYIATDYVPSSTQHVIDMKYLFASARIPVFDPRNHQDMYEVAWHAADVSRKFRTPVVVLASGILTHSEGMVVTKEQRKITPRDLPENLHEWMTLPGIARKNYNIATQERIPLIKKWLMTSPLIKEEEGKDDFGIIVSGETYVIVKEALKTLSLQPSIISTAMANPVPVEKIKEFVSKISGQVFVFEDGDKFMQEKLQLAGLDVIGKDEYSTTTVWNPETIINIISKHRNIDYHTKKYITKTSPVMRPPAICPGCPYRAFGLAVSKLKKQKKIYQAFGDIGCSTLLYFMNALDTVLCMGGSDPMRQGFVMSRPDMEHKTISIIGDSCECHSGLDATRNAIFRNTPGVKVLLDNSITAMTGGQPAPSTIYNLAGQPHRFNLRKAVEAEGGKVVVANAYDLKEVETVLKDALIAAEKGDFTTLIFEGPCIHEVENKRKTRTIYIHEDNCKRCGRCNICPGIELDDTGLPHFTNQCSNCGSNPQVCMQRCPHDAIRNIDLSKVVKPALPEIQEIDIVSLPEINKTDLPESIRIAIRGIGGQGNLFFGKVLSEVAMRTPYADTHIVKGDTHGMAQLGGSVISTFSCGDVYSSVLAPESTDLLVVMETSEVLRPGFIDLLKKGGKIIMNNYKVVPPTAKKEDYPDVKEIFNSLNDYDIIEINANEVAYSLGDTEGKTANVVILGLLSTIQPFNKIPYDIWIDALMSVSPNKYTKSANKLAFDAGVNFNRK